MRSNRVGVVQRVGGLALLAATVVSVSPACAQVITTVSNSGLRLQVGESGQLNSANVAGRFGLIDLANPTGPILRLPRNNTNLLGSYVTVRIDGGTPAGMTAPTQTIPGWDLVFGDVGVSGATDQGRWVVAPTVVGTNKIRAVWSTLPGANTAVPIPSIQIEFLGTLIGTTACFQFRIQNLDTKAHTVGLRFAQDFDVAAGTAGPIQTPNLGPISSEVALTGSAVPAFWRVANTTDLSDPSLLRSAGGALRSGPGSSTPTNADSVTFGNTVNISPSLWATPITGGALAVNGKMAAAFFNPTQYSPGEQKTTTTYFGTQFASDNFQGRLALSVTGPLALKFDTLTSRYTPNPAAISARVYNSNTISATNVAATISLPSGLQLAAGETATKAVGTIAPDTEGSASWNIVPAINASGRLQYTVTVTGQPGAQSVTVSRTLDIPPAPGITQPQAAGLRLVSFPYVFSDPTPATALGLNSALFDLLNWNGVLNQYEVPRAIAPGKGFFLNLRSPQSFRYTGSALIDGSVSQFEIPLNRSWNMIGNPFGFRVLWADVLVLNTDINDPDYLVPLTVAQASHPSRGWILPSVYWWDGTQYLWDTDFTTALDPFQGFWVKAQRRNISLLIPAASGGRSVKNAGLSPVGSIAWKQRIVVSSDGYEDRQNFLGLSSSAKEGSDYFDVPKPPAARTGVLEVGFLHNDWNQNSGRYAQDIRVLSGSEKAWEFTVTSPRPNTDVTVSWPEVRSLPRNVDLTLVDPATGARTSLRQTSSIRISTGDTGTRAVKFIATTRTAQGALRIVNTAVQGRGVGAAAIRFSSSKDADFSVRIVGSTGRLVRNLSSRAARAGEATELAWDYRDNRGSSVPSGSYTIEITGRGDDGQSAKVFIPHVVVR